MNQTILEVKDLKKYFPIKGGILGRTVNNVFAIDGVDLVLKEGQTIGLVGESGCGKSTLGRTILKLIEPSGGRIIFQGEDITDYSEGKMRAKRKDLQIIFQDPFSSLNPRMKVSEIIKEPLKIHQICKKEEMDSYVDELLDLVGLGAASRDKYPHEFSGGQRQRIGIARAVALKPKVIIADEPVSALDVSIQSQVLNLLVELKEKFNLSYIFIAHDLAVIEHISDIVAVMYLGRIVEYADAEDLYKNPRHPYTNALIAAIPIPEVTGEKREKQIVQGDVPSPISPPVGCHFSPRCPKAAEKCFELYPELKNFGSEDKPHLVACHYVR